MGQCGLKIQGNPSGGVLHQQGQAKACPPRCWRSTIHSRELALYHTAGMHAVSRLPQACPHFHVGVGLSLLSRVVTAEEGLHGG